METNVKQQSKQNLSKRFLVDPYENWVKKEKIPVYIDFGHNLLKLETGPWERWEIHGCFAHTHGRGDFMANYLLALEPGKKSAPIRHIYEAFFYVLKGFGSVDVKYPNGESRTFEFGEKALFTIPLNCSYRIFNGSGRESLRLSCTNNAPLVLNLFHNEKFVFENDFDFPERVGADDHYSGEGEHLMVNRGDNVAEANLWETNFVSDLTNFKLYAMDARGKGSLNVSFILADSTMHAHSSEIPSGHYKKAHRHAAGTHVHAVSGVGYTLLWYEGDKEFVEIPWEHGFMYTPPFWMFHQHFNTGPEPARYLACSMGSRRFPFIALRRKSAEGKGATSIQEGGRQVEYEDQDNRIHRKWLEVIKACGVDSKMGDIFDEETIMSLTTSDLSGTIKTPESIGPVV